MKNTFIINQKNQTEPIKFILLLTARQGAQTSIYMATDEKLKGISDQYFQFVSL